MGNRLVKPPPYDRPMGSARGRKNQYPRAFPILTPQSYLPGGAGVGLAGVYPSTGASRFPSLGPNSYFQPQGTLDPPLINFNNPPSILPGSASYPSLMPPAITVPPPMPYPNQNSMSMIRPPLPSPIYDPGFASYSRSRPIRVCRRRRSRRCRPVIHIVDSSSCSSISTCRSLSPCPRRRHRSRSCSRRRAVTSQPQQPIIVLPIQCQQPTGSAQTAPMMSQPQPQQIILPPIQMQQTGQMIPQSAGLPPIQIQSLTGSMQPQTLTLPQLQMNSSSIIPNMSSIPMIIGNGQSVIQPASSVPQIANIGQIQTAPSGSIQYVQTMPQSSSQLQYVTAGSRSVGAPSHVLVNSTNKKPTSIMKPVQRSASARQITQMDLKYGRRPFDWYNNTQKDKIINEDIELGQS